MTRNLQFQNKDLKMKTLSYASMLVLMLAAISAKADIVTVTTTGVVEQNQIHSGPLSLVHAGDATTMIFTVDSGNFVNSPNFPTRGYPISPASFGLNFPALSVGLQNPFPLGQTPYFSIRHNDPAVDGFMLTTNYDFQNGVPTDQTGAFGQFVDNYYVTYQHGTLPSLNVLDALGTYNYNGLTVFNWTLDDGPFNAMLIDFTQMTITPEPAGLAVLALGSLMLLRSRRSRRA